MGYEATISLGDSLTALRQDGSRFNRGLTIAMPSVRKQARWPEAIVITIALWLFVTLIVLPLIVKRHEGEGWTSIALDIATIPVSMLFALPMFAVFRKTLDWGQDKRAFILVATVLLTATANIMFDLLFQAWVANHLDTAWANLGTDFARVYPSFFNYILVFGINMALFQVSFSRRAALKQELQLSHARSAAQQAQLAALRYQLNPHFLFNSLNSISALIVTNRNQDAERMTDKLSNFLRSSLNADPSELVMLDEELAITEEYLEIESVRFGERLNVSVDCAPDACEALVPSFLVQPLVENAIKHGVSPSRQAVDIDIHADVTDGDLCITVANCITGDAAEEEARNKQSFGRKGVGLQNVRRRLEAVYGEAATLSAETKDGRYVATICIPKIQHRR
jgi:signal transduction histidine kinase